MKEGIYLVDIEFYTNCMMTFVIIGFGRAILILPKVIQLLIEDAFLYPDSTHTLLSYKISVTMLSMWKLIMTTMMNINSSQK